MSTLPEHAIATPIREDDPTGLLRGNMLSAHLHTVEHKKSDKMKNVVEGMTTSRLILVGPKVEVTPSSRKLCYFIWSYGLLCRFLCCASSQPGGRQSQ